MVLRRSAQPTHVIDDEDDDVISHSLPEIEESHSLPNGAEDLKHQPSVRSVISHSKKEDAEHSLPFHSEDVKMDAHEQSGCCNRRRKICCAAFTVVAVIAIGLGVGLSGKGKEAVNYAESVLGLGSGPRRDPDMENRGAIRLTSPEFDYGEPIPIRYTSDGGDESPPLYWENLPEGTKSIAVICEDVDYPHPSRPSSKPFVHWIAYDVHSVLMNLPENVPKEKTMAIDGVDSATGEKYFIDIEQGVTSWGLRLENDEPQGRAYGWGYHGPDPPIGDPAHRYYFRILALDGTVKEHLPDDPANQVTAEVFKELTEGDDPEVNVLGFGLLMGTYQKMT